MIILPIILTALITLSAYNEPKVPAKTSREIYNYERGHR